MSCQDRRDEVIRPRPGKSGRARGAQIINFGHCQALRGCVRQWSARVRANALMLVDKILQLVPHPAAPAPGK